MQNELVHKSRSGNSYLTAVHFLLCDGKDPWHWFFFCVQNWFCGRWCELNDLFVSAGNSNIEHGIEGMENSRIKCQESQGTDIQHLRSGCSTRNCTCGREDVWAAVLQQQAWRSFSIKCMFRPQISIYQHRVLCDYMRTTRAMSDWQQSKCKVETTCVSYELQFLYMRVPVLLSLKFKRFASLKAFSSYQEENHNSGMWFL